MSQKYKQCYSLSAGFFQLSKEKCWRPCLGFALWEGKDNPFLTFLLEDLLACGWLREILQSFYARSFSIHCECWWAILALLVVQWGRHHSQQLCELSSVCFWRQKLGMKKNKTVEVIDKKFEFIIFPFSLSKKKFLSLKKYGILF